jgi:phospholipid/cholesterol/gamma-HCH transport system permease protein
MSAAAQAGVASEPALFETVDAQGRRQVLVSGVWNLQALSPRMAEIERTIGTIVDRHAAVWDLRQVTKMDHLGAALLQRAFGGLTESIHARPEHEPLFRRLALAETTAEVKPPRSALRILVAPGVQVLRALDHGRDFVELVGHVSLEFARMMRHPARAPWREISANIYRTGTQALGITALVGFLIGVVLSYLSSTQLKLFGADLFIVNILGVSIIRELGPVLAAILVAGRSGSSMTAQIGVMRVTQELDAMSVMGIPHMSRLVLPRVIALALGLPLLVLWTNAVALLGGMVAAYAELRLSILYFIDKLPQAVPVANLYIGVGKGMVFGVLIALLACHYGMRIRPNTESLGEGTTNSVVTAITIVILVDAIFAVLFRDVGMGF